LRSSQPRTALGTEARTGRTITPAAGTAFLQSDAARQAEFGVLGIVGIARGATHAAPRHWCLALRPSIRRNLHASKHAASQRLFHERGKRAGQLHHFRYRLANLPVVDLELVERRKIGRSLRCVSGPLALRLRKRKIEPGRELPRRAIELGSLGKE